MEEGSGSNGAREPQEARLQSPDSQMKRPQHSPPQHDATAGEQTKRRRTDLNITDLPDEGLRLIADYLPKSSRALLALAITTDSASWRDINWNKSIAPTLTSFLRREKQQRPLAATRAVLLKSSAGGDDNERFWEHVDFVDIGDLASRLNDDDVAGFLMCINAIQKLKTLKLTGVVNITGRGLDPLRGSRILEQLDLSLVGLDESPDLSPQPLIKDTVVVPILDSILIDQSDHNMKHLQFPRKWKRSGLLDQFILRYDQTEYRRNMCCLQCRRRCKDVLSQSRSDFSCRIEQNTCYGCLKHYCYDCLDEDPNFDAEEWGPMLTFCNVCEKEYCARCSGNDSDGMRGMFECTGRPCGRDCHKCVCDHCYEKGTGKCMECGNAFCKDCQEDDFMSCEGCGDRACYMCMQLDTCEFEGCDAENCHRCVDDKVNAVSFCFESDCQNSYCFQHRLEQCNKDWNTCCEGCMRLIGPELKRGYVPRVT